MAINISFEPTKYNVANAPILYNVTSSLYNQPQYQYVCDLKNTSGELLTRIKQYPNPNSTATFDLARIVNDYLEWSYDYFTISGSFGLDKTDEYQDFEILFGEEYGTSLTSNVTLYDGNDVAGDPIITGSNSPISVWQGTVDINNGIGWNWGDVYPTSSVTPLTNYPNSGLYSQRKDDNRNVSISDYGIMGIYDPSDIAPPYTYKLYNSSNSLITSSVLDLSNSGSVLNYIPTGPKNLLSMGFTQGDLDDTTYYHIEYDTDKIAKYNLVEDCNYERVNFLFINSFGVWDHYGINLPVRKTTDLQRKEITKPFIQWSDLTPTYNQKNRGTDYYRSMTMDKYVISTQFLTDDTAYFVKDLIESPNVYIQINNTKLKYGFSNGNVEFVPINITNSSYVWKTNPKNQRVFQYDIEYKFSNQRYSI
jgi:hypothetical protein